MLTLFAALQARLVQVDVATLALFVGLILPLVVATVAKARASSTMKALINAVLAAIGGGASLLIANDGSMPARDLIVSIVIAFVVSGAAYQHLWKPLGWADAIAAYFPGGIGTPTEPYHPAEPPIIDVPDDPAAPHGRNPERRG